jgi:hypothetical protein
MPADTAKSECERVREGGRRERETDIAPFACNSPPPHTLHLGVDVNGKHIKLPLSNANERGPNIQERREGNVMKEWKQERKGMKLKNMMSGVPGQEREGRRRERNPSHPHTHTRRRERTGG